jgi:hypothetical protein
VFDPGICWFGHEVIVPAPIFADVFSEAVQDLQCACKAVERPKVGEAHS